MICIKSMVKAAKIMFIKRLLNTQDTKWKYISWLMLGIDKNLLFSRINLVLLNGNCLSPFYGQFLDIWYELIDIEPKSPSDIVHENIFNNNQIPIAIDARVREHFVAKGITKIKHLLTEDKIILGYNAIKDKYSIYINYLVYLQVISSIPMK